MAGDLFDWNKVDQVVNPRPVNKLDYESNKHMFRKVAFDAYKALDGNSDRLWELRDEEDGKTYLYALYGDASELIANSNEEEKDWKAAADSDGKNVTLAYKQVPIYRFASDKYPFSQDSARKFAEFVESKAQDSEWISDLMQNGMSAERRAVVSKLIRGD
jgi:hypothetical protein